MHYTANQIAQYHNLKVKITKELIDFDFGSWEGQPDKEIKEVSSVLSSLEKKTRKTENTYFNPIE